MVLYLVWLIKKKIRTNVACQKREYFKIFWHKTNFRFKKAQNKGKSLFKIIISIYQLYQTVRSQYRNVVLEGQVTWT